MYRDGSIKKPYALMAPPAPSGLTQSPAGTKWAVGAEIHLVNRLKKENPGRFIIPLDDCGCLCSTMFRIDPQHLLWSLENLLEGRVVNQITVPEGLAANARVALNRMLEIAARSIVQRFRVMVQWACTDSTADLYMTEEI